MKSQREYVKPTVTKVAVQPDESVIVACKPDFATCTIEVKALFEYGS